LFFFSFKDKAVVMEVLGFCCLAIVSTALKNKGELREMPGTSE
jgi:hypothetical protein